MSTANSEAHRILRRRQVEEITGLSRSTIYRRMQAGTFPPAVPLGGRLVGWRAADIERFLENPARYRAPVPARDDEMAHASGRAP
ncbi:AlpA family transcriptional regulator [Paraburkholderia strydomiana]|jgi:prophage regulatory protein|uniref:AlpA family transcriptional regulator n=1 Tax=Paraburkholderia strydomiana TaxID=1245417 RepID=A0ABW9EQL8_9BURK